MGPVISIGELLWDFLPDGKLLGGAPSNLACRLTELGSPCSLVSRIGNDFLGQQAIKMLSLIGMSTDFIQEDEMYPTGTVKVNFDEHKNPDYYIVEDVAFDYIDVNEPLIEAAREASCITFGTLAQRSDTSRKTIYKLIESAGSAIKFLDVNLRKNCYTPEIIDKSVRMADIVKLNLQEAEYISGLFGFSGDRIEEIAEWFYRFFGVRTVIITLENYGAFLTDENTGQIYFPGYNIRLEDPLGAGDAFSAAFIHNLLEGFGPAEACRQGNILGAAVASSKGATQPMDNDYINNVVFQEKFNKLNELSSYISISTSFK